MNRVTGFLSRGVEGVSVILLEVPSMLACNNDRKNNGTKCLFN